LQQASAPSSSGSEFSEAERLAAILPSPPEKGSDVEVLYLARRSDIPVAEVPIDWHYRTGSKVRPVRDTLRILADLAAIRLNAIRGRYRNTEPS